MDYDVDPAVLTFPTGSTQGTRRCVNVSIHEDVAVENNEYFHMTLTSGDARLEISSICQRATVTIIDTDGKTLHIIGHYPHSTFRS